VSGAMGQIPRSTEHISSFLNFCLFHCFKLGTLLLY